MSGTPKTEPDASPPEPGTTRPVRARCPLSKRFLLKYYPERRMIETQERGTLYRIDLDLLASDQSDPDAVKIIAPHVAQASPGST